MNHDKMLQWIGTHDVGISSRTMWCALMGVANSDTPPASDFDVPHGVSDFSKCYDLVTFCEVTKEELQKVVEAFPYYKPIIDEWDNLASAYAQADYNRVFDIIHERYDEIMELKGYTKKGHGYWVRQQNNG